MTPADAEALAAKLLPRLNQTRTCQSWCRVIVRLVERPHRRRVCYAAMRQAGKTWSPNTIAGWLREKAHTPEAQAKRIAAKRRMKAKRKASRV